MTPLSLHTLEPARASLLSTPEVVAHGLLLALTAAAFAWILLRRAALLRRAEADPRLDALGARLRALLVVGFGQSRQPRYPVAGTLHILIFAGFLVLLLRSLTLLGEGFAPGFALPGLGGGAGEVYAAVKDWTALTVLACCAVAAFRRLVLKPERYHDRHARGSHGGEAYVILSLIALLMLADALFEGAELAGESERTWALPLASACAGVLEGRSAETLHGLGRLGFWVHNVLLCFFLCYLPISKHFHVLTALPNVFLSKLPPAGRVKPPRHGAAAEEQGDGKGADEGDEGFGVARLEDFTWKHLLDFYSCTDCGRCSDACPAYRTGTPLSPRMISVKCRDEAYASLPVFGRERVDRPALVGEVIRDEELWACTTCGACEETCPVLIEYVDKVVDMRRILVDEGRVPKTMQAALAQIEKRGNPYGKLARKRGDWVAGDGDSGDGGSGDEDTGGAVCGVRVLAKGEAAELCYFTDSATAFDPRLQEVGRALGGLLRGAGVDCGTLGKDEVDSGHEVRRVGEEGLFELLREQNLTALEARDFERVVTSDPHALNALRNDYALDRPVLHHTELLAELVEGGRLPLAPLADDRVFTFHDPCYLGRHSGVFDAPRRVLAAIPGLRTVEMAASRCRSFCCGGGSLYLFHEGESETRMGDLRLEMAAEAGAEVVVTACPFCLVNFEDSIKTTGRAGSMEVLDLAELVHRAATEAPRDEPEPPPTAS